MAQELATGQRLEYTSKGGVMVTKQIKRRNRKDCKYYTRVLADLLRVASSVGQTYFPNLEYCTHPKKVWRSCNGVCQFFKRKEG